MLATAKRGVTHPPCVGTPHWLPFSLPTFSFSEKSGSGEGVTTPIGQRGGAAAVMGQASTRPAFGLGGEVPGAALGWLGTENLPESGKENKAYKSTPAWSPCKASPLTCPHQKLTPSFSSLLIHLRVFQFRCPYTRPQLPRRSTRPLPLTVLPADHHPPGTPYTLYHQPKLYIFISKIYKNPN